MTSGESPGGVSRTGPGPLLGQSGAGRPA